MKRFKKELSWLLVAALVVSSLVIGVGQLKTSAVQATGQLGTFRVSCRTSSQNCAGTGTDADFELVFKYDDQNNWFSGNFVPDGDMEAGETNSWVVSNVPVKPIESINFRMMDYNNNDDWYWDWVKIEYLYDGTNYVEVGYNDGDGQTASAGALINFNYNGAIDTTFNKTLTFYGNGGSLSPSTPYTLNAIQGATLPASNFPTIGTRTGYTPKASWYSAPVGDSVLTLPTTVPGGDMAYYAQWNPILYAIAFSGNGATGGSTLTMSCAYDTPYTLNSNGFSRTGYTFAGWATSADGAVAYSNGQSVSNLTATSGATVNLYAKWIPITYTVMYDGNGNTGGNTGNSHYSYNETSSLSVNGFTKTGYSFSGWSTSPGGALAYLDGQSVTNLASTQNAIITLYARWTPAYVNITFDANGGLGSTGPNTLSVGSALSAPAVTREGYTFVAWSPSVPDTVPGTDRTYTAVWLANGELNDNSYNVIFNANGGEGTQPAQSIQFGQTAVLTSNVFTRTGYTFFGWATSAWIADSGAPEYFDGDHYTMAAEDITLYAVWRQNRYQITFNANGGSGGSSAFVEYGAALSSPACARFGYTLTGWVPAVPPVMPAEDIECVAQWTGVTYTVAYNANGSDSGSTGSSSHTYGAANTLTANGFNKTGHTFTGWAIEQNGPVIYTDSQSVTNLASTNGATVTLYAKWTANSYTITFNANGGSGSSSVTMVYGTPLSAPSVFKTGYTFLSWSPALPSTVPATNATYTAQWTPITYTVAYNANGGSGTTASTSHTYDSARTLNWNNFTRTGYTFAGWATSTSGSVVYSNGQSVSNLTSTNGSTVTLYARWTTNSYTITFDANGGTGGSSSAKTYGATLTAPTVTRTGFTFKSWSPSVPTSVPAADVTYTAQWTEDTTWTITFSANGGTGGTSTVMVSGTALTAPTVTRAGYTFVSWSPTVPSTSPAADVTYTAQWRQTTYTITFDANGGTGGTNASMVPGAALSAPTVTRTGYTFAGWSPAVPSTVPEANTTYVAQWTVNTYTITFNANGGSGGTSDPMTYGSALSAPAVAKTGYTLASWSPSVPSTVPAANTTYNAQWTANTYTVSYNANGGSGSMTSVTHTYDTAKNLSNNSFTRTGYTFMGWNTAANGSGTSYTNSQSVLNLTATKSATVILYAQWAINSYTMTFNANGGSGGTSWSKVYGSTLTAPEVERSGYTFAGWSPTVPATVPAVNSTYVAQWTVNTYNISYNPNASSGWYGSTPASAHTYDVVSQLTANGFIRTGYTFMGWATSAGGFLIFLDGDYVSNLTTDAGGTVVLYAVWQPNMYTVAYNANGGSGNMQNTYHTYDTAANLRTNAFTRTGYTFVGWATSPTGAVAYANGASVTNLTTSGTYSLYAKWIPNNYTVVYNGNGSTSGNTNNSAHTYDVAKNLNANGYTKLGNTFQGWALTNTATEPMWADQDSVLNLSSINGSVITFYAVWSLNYYTITFDANGGSGGTSASLPYGSILTSPTVTREGHTFTGWVPSAPTTVPATDNTYYAMWSPKSYPVTFDANGGTGGMSGFMVYGSELTPPVVTRAGHIFLGWSPEAPATVQAGAATYTAQWEAYIVTITFDANGGTGGTSGIMNCETPLTAPADPTRVGYVFAGWLPAVPETVPTQDTTYTAQWTPVDYTVTFDANGGTGSAAPITQGYETTVTLPAEGFEKTGYSFVGWNTQPDATTALASYNMPLNGGTLYAVYTINTYTVTFNSDGGSFVSPLTQNFATDIEAPSDPVRPGYTFAGWQPAVPVVMPAFDTQCAAQWAINQYTVTFDANGGEGSAASVTQDYTTVVVLPATGFTKTGYTFIGWNTEPGAATALGSYSVTAEDATLYAVYMVNQYSVSFDAAGGSMVNTITQDYGTGITSPADPSREGYTFAGWSPAVPAVMPDENTECVAQWTINNYTVSFDANGGTAVDGITQDYATEITAPADPARPGYVFVGWVPAVPATMPAENIVCAAQWELAGPVTLSVSSASGAADSNVVISVSISENSGLAAGELYLSFDNTKIAFVNAENGSATAGAMTDIFAQTPNGNTTVIKQNIIDLDGMTLAGTMMQITFSVLPGWMGSTPLQLTVGEFFENSLVPLETIIQNGDVTSTTSIITFDSNGGSAVATLTGNEGDTLAAPADPVKVGYSFAGWDPELPAVYPVNGLNVTALWDINQYTVTFDANGGEGTVEAITQDYNTAAILPEEGYTKTGYTFVGWNTDPFAQEAMTSYIIPAEDTVLYAIYAINQYTVIFDAAGGTAVGSITQEYATAVTAPEDPMREGYTFAGWLPAVPEFMPAEDTVCVADWAINSYTVTFDANGGEGGTAQALAYSTELTAPTVTREGYTFAGWSPAVPATVPAEDAVYTAQWTINSYTVSFDSAGGTAVGSITQEYATAVTAPEDPMREGYTFAGWLPAVPEFMPAEDTVCVADWTINSYTVTFDANGGEGGTSGLMEFGAEIVAPTVTRAGYTLLGWEPEVPAAVPAGDTTYTAAWMINQYAITFDSAGGTAVESITQDYGTEITAPADPEREGYTFAGWSPAIPATMPDSNIECVAQWQINQYTLSFDSNGGTAVADITQDYAAEITAPAAPTREGYTFAGWLPAIPAAMPAANTMCAAQWTINSYTVTFDANGGEGGTAQALVYSAELTAPVVSREGYTFAGWSPAVPATVPAEDTVYTAEWTINQYTVTFDANGGEGTAEPVIQNYKTNVTLPVTGFEKTGFNFLGWNTSPTATTAMVSYTVPATDSVLYAIYGVNSYTVTFDANGGEGGTSATMEFGAELYAPAVTRMGYTFAGWTPAVPETVEAGNITYTAQWTINQYTVSFDSAGGTAVDAIVQDYAGEVTAPAAPSREGYTFAGWTPVIPATMPAADMICVAQWTINQYTVSFESAGGSAVESITQDYATAITAPADPEREGYTFAGWNPTIPAAMPSEDMVCVAQWTINQYTVSFDSAGGTATDSIVQDYETEITAPADPTKTGYTFAGWLPAVPATMPAADTICVAQWTINSYTVSFDSAGGTAVESIVQDYATEITAPLDPTRAGYTFANWEPAVPAVMPAGDVGCVAQWTINQYTVTFDANGGEGEAAAVTQDYETVIALPAAGFAKTGYTFIGWNTDPFAQAAITEYSIPAEDTVLYAIYTINQYTVSFDANGGEGETAAVTQDYATAIELPAAGFAKTGYTFIGWNTDPFAQEAMTSYIIPAEDTVLYAIYTINSYTVTFDANGGEGGTSEVMVYATALSAPVVTKTGYSFTGWNPEVPETVQAEDSVYVAQWTINSYTISFDTNGGTVVDSIVQEYATEITAPADPEREGYTFAGWAPEIPATMPAEDVECVAQWTINSYTVTFDANGGEGGTVETLAYSAELTAPVVSREGYTFAGWSPAVPAAVPAEDTIYAAQWQINQYMVTFDANGGEGYAEAATQDYATAVELPAAGFVKTGYTFIGWNTDPFAQAAITEYSIPAEDTVLYAIYTINQYTVTFDANGGEGVVEAITQDYNTAAILPEEGYTKTGYTFVGWNTDPFAQEAMTGYIIPAEDTVLYAIYAINQYTVSFDSAGGTAVGSITQEYTTAVTAPEDPMREGYTFAGWLPAVPEFMPAEDTVCVADWTINSYTVTFDANGGEGGTAQALVYSTELTAPTVTREGYTFAGWSPAVPATVPAEDAVYTAQWTINSYTVSFDSAGGTAVGSITQDYATAVTAPADPTREGYTFAGWIPVIPEVMPADDVVCVAQWQTNQYTVTFDSNGGEGAAAAVTQDYATAIELPAAGFSKTGGTFIGWNINPNAEEAISEYIIPAEDTVLYAIYTINQYTVSLDSAGGTAVESITQDYATEIAAPADPTRTGYTFAGWSPAIPAAMPAADTVCVAQWTINQYVVSFNADGGTAVEAIEQDYATEITAPADPMREGYIFAGWIPEVPAVMPAEDIVCIAQWLPIIAAPASLVCIAKTDDTATLEWPAVSNAEGYNVYCDGEKITQAPINSLTYVAEGLTPETQYTFTVTAVGASRESEHSPVCVVTTDVWIAPQVELTVGNKLGLPNQFVTIPVTVLPNVGIASAMLKLNFDPEVLDYIEITSGPTFPGTLSVNADDHLNGTVSISYMTLVPDVAGGTILNVKLRVKPEAQYQSSGLQMEVLELTDYDCNDLTYSTVQGAVRVGMLGDVNGDGAIRAVDALLALQASSGRYILDEEQFLLADVNGSGTITSVDALRILQYSAGRIISF